MNDRRRDVDQRGRLGIVQRQPAIEVPPRFARSVFVVKNGERLWAAQDALDLVSWLADHGFAMLGGEVYSRHEIGWGTYSREWSTSPPREPAESWSRFVERGRAVAVDFLERELISPTDPPQLYFLAFAAEGEPDVHPS